MLALWLRRSNPHALQRDEPDGDSRTRRDEPPPDRLTKGEQRDRDDRVHGFAQQLEEPLLEGLMLGDDGPDSAAGVHDRGDKVRDLVGAGSGPRSATRHLDDCRRTADHRADPSSLKTRHLEPHARGAAEEVRERAGSDRTSPIDHADPIADVLGLLEEVRVQKDRGPPITHLRMIPRTSWRPTGSSALVGSSKMTRSGSPTSATASPRRCCMPLEKVPTLSSRRSARPTVSSDFVDRVHELGHEAAGSGDSAASALQPAVSQLWNLKSSGR